MRETFSATFGTGISNPVFPIQKIVLILQIYNFCLSEYKNVRIKFVNYLVALIQNRSCAFENITVLLNFTK